ncbi:MAG: acyloxyacyl hydrolase [Limisphaerales bacterium]
MISDVGRVRALDFFAGVRGGAALEGSLRRFHQAEAFGGIELPCRWRFWSDWYLRPGADASAGWISDNNTSAFIGSMGPLVELGKGRFPLTLEGGVAPTLLNRHRFSSRNFGDNFQFTSHLGLNWKISRHFTVGARFQHMSNAGITHFNPGLNLEMLSLRFDF